MALIEVRNLTKDYIVKPDNAQAKGMFTGHNKQVKRAVDDIRFDIQPGELVGYIGPNGAGKSTTIKMLTGILKPTAGTCKRRRLTAHHHTTPAIQAGRRFYEQCF